MHGNGCSDCSNYKRNEQPDKNAHIKTAIAELEQEAFDEINRITTDWFRMEQISKSIQQLKGLMR